MLQVQTVQCRQQEGTAPQLLISDTTGPEGPRSLYIFERWCPLVLLIEGKNAVQVLACSFYTLENPMLAVYKHYKLERPCACAAKEGLHTLSMLPTVADKYMVHTSCMQQLQFSAGQAGLCLEAILPRQADH